MRQQAQPRRCREEWPEIVPRGDCSRYNENMISKMGVLKRPLPAAPPRSIRAKGLR